MEAHSARLTIEATRTQNVLTLRVTLTDETSVPQLTGAATLAVEKCGPGDLDGAIRCIALQSILDKCEDLGWRQMPATDRATLKKWTEHSALAHVLRSLLDGIEQNDQRRTRAADGDGTRDRERPVVVVDRPEQPRLDPMRDLIGRGAVLQPESERACG